MDGEMCMKLSGPLLGILVLVMILWFMNKLSDDVALWIMGAGIGVLYVLSERAEKRGK